MQELVVRRLLIDLEQPFERHWNGGDAFRTALLNALSMSFPLGEQFFIDAVRAGVKVLPEAEQARFAAEVQGFVGQEATHRRIHALFNAQLASQGYRNRWEARIARRTAQLEGADPRHAVAITAATEHFTAIFAEFLLAHPRWLAGAAPRLQTMWLWHAAEESEHRSTAFDLYAALGGDHRWRVRWFRMVSFFFVTDALRQTLNNLWRDGHLFRWRTWTSAVRFMFGRDGLVRKTCQPWRAYLRRDFHPRQQDDRLAQQWLQEHITQYTLVGRRPI
ncbi:metal-dependent hydrolase [Schlegelella sp. S2-27]|uniref:Metal-dependent hydrolase n=1 Tax=Caldimonas mangrovi TaxID=2944811 RepID=A0ABT0YQY0_9BURK|nr:metal-dependent hydrolase [Caldimonas mangrovi]MCM5681157.1 metal-dependent hydrolase [Caldimonas mangrovi]